MFVVCVKANAFTSFYCYRHTTGTYERGYSEDDEGDPTAANNSSHIMNGYENEYRETGETA